MLHIHPTALQGALSRPGTGGAGRTMLGLSGRDYAGFGMRTSENTTLLRGWVNKADRLDPTPHLFFVAQVLFAELPLQVPLLAFDDATLDHQQRYRQKKDGPQRVRKASDARVDQRHGEVTGVACVTKGAFRGYALDWLVGVGRRVGLAHGPFEPAQEQDPSAEQCPSEAARHRARQEAHREPPAQQQAEDQSSQVDQGRRRDDPRLVLLVAGHRYRPPCSRQDRVGNLESMMPPTRARCELLRTPLNGSPTSENSPSTHSGE